ncbi:IclR family transcriptional regulator YiaJ, partial [Pseudomonas aeruginosa]
AGSYRLTTKFIAVGQKALSSLNIIHIAAPHLEALNIATGETINFSSREDDHAILIYKLEPTTGMLRTRAYIGQHMPLYCSAMGKIYMAFGHPDYVKSYWESHQHEIQPLTRNTI